MKKIYIVVAAVLLIGGVYAVSRTKIPAPRVTPSVVGERTYVNERYGISFTYPQNYVITEAERGDGHRGHYVITLVKQEDAAPRENSEGPVAIVFDIYQNNLDRQTLRGWLEGSSYSNYKLSNDTYMMTHVGGADAVAYRWSGLYEATTTAFIHNDNIVAASVTYITPEDTQIAVYHDILKSVRLLAPTASVSYENASADMINITTPLPGTVVSKKFAITGQARGPWYFEASFPIEINDVRGAVVARTTATAQGDWMTEDFVPFRAEVVMPDAYIGPATVVLKKDNPSGLAEHDAAASLGVVVK